jgi:hypothetical protein
VLNAIELGIATKPNGGSKQLSAPNTKKAWLGLGGFHHQGRDLWVHHFSTNDAPPSSLLDPKKVQLC